MGLRAVVGPAIGISVWGFVTGVAMVKAGMPAWLGIVMSLVVFAGSAQLAAIPLIAASAPMPVIWLTAGLVNLRFVIFAAATRRYLAPWSLGRRLFASYLLGDLGFALFMARYGDTEEYGTNEQFGFVTAVVITNWIAWQSSSIVGIIAGGFAPERWGLELAAVLALVAVLIPLLANLPGAAGAIATGIVAVATIGWPYRLGLVVSIVVGVTVALAAEKTRARRRLSAAGGQAA